MEEFLIPHQLVNVLRVQKIVADLVTGKATQFSECAKPVVSSTHVERKSGYLVAFRIDDRQDNAFNKTTIQAFTAIPDKLKKSSTVDNGKEFAAHKKLAEATGMKVYFCDPYSPWQRGTNENTNGLLRQFFPKATSFADITDEEIQLVVDLINNRPRKRLNFLTPFEVLKKFFQ